MVKKGLLISVDDVLTTRQLIELETCVRCGACAEACPVYKASEDVLAMPALKLKELRDLVHRGQGILASIFKPKPVDVKELERIAKEAYTCTLCGRCMPGCVFGIQNRELREALRFILYRSGVIPDQLKKIASYLDEKKNPFNAEPADRLKWVAYSLSELGEIPVNKRAETVYFVGCRTSLIEPNHDIARLTAFLLNHVGEDWTILGENEWCSGVSWIAIGDVEKARDYARHNVRLIESLGAKKVVVTDAECYAMLKWRYPQLIFRQPNFKVLHITEYLADCIEKGKIDFYGDIDKVVTYHDPCMLSRLGGVVEEPRLILNTLTSKFVEMPENKMDTYCCGGGGFLPEVNRELSMKIAKTRIGHAKEVGAEVIVTSCPMCREMLREAVKELNEKIEVVDIVELAVKKMKPIERAQIV